MRWYIIGGAIIGLYIFRVHEYLVWEDSPNPCEVAKVMAHNDTLFKMCKLELTDELQNKFNLMVIQANSNHTEKFVRCYKDEVATSETIAKVIDGGRESLRPMFCNGLREKGENFFKPLH